MGRVTRWYERALRFVLAWPITLIVGGIGLIVASLLLLSGRSARDLLPAMDEGGFILDYLMPAGSSLDDTNQVLLGVEKILKATPEVESTSRRTGLQLGLAAVTEANRGDFSVKLKRDRDRAIDEVISDVRAQGQREVSAARRRIHPGAAGHDRRSDQFAGADGDQTVFAGPRAAEGMGRQRSATNSRRSRAWWT